VSPSIRLIVRLQELSSGSCIPQHIYCQGAPLPDGAGQSIVFEMQDGGCFPASLALTGQCDLLVGAGDAVFSGRYHTINLRIEVFGLFVTLKLLFI